MTTSPVNDGTPRRVTVEVQAYDRAYGSVSWFDEGAMLRLETSPNPEPIVIISGNPAGLTFLARHLLSLAQDAVPDGNHMDFDTYLGVLCR